jgi:hypothetical protein
MLRRAAVLLPLIGVSLRLRGYGRTQEWLQARWERRCPSLPQAAGSKDTVEKTCRMVRAAVRHGMPGASCLEASLTLWYLLRLQGIPANLRIGVRKHANLFEAHAWVEHEGAALNQVEEVHRHFAPFDSKFLVPPNEQP